jgi:uncharacterized damage-inducible protein DinB
MADRTTPYLDADEPTTLTVFLDYLRGCVVAKVPGLDDKDAARPLVPSGTSLAELVKHLTNVERFWIQHLWAGHDGVPLDRNHWNPGTDIAALVEEYEKACAENNRIVTSDPDMARGCVREWNGEHLPLRWVLVHLIEETGRRAGHADILRELIDGQVGR